MKRARPTLEPTVLQRAKHNLSRKAISKNALKVLYRLNQEGFEAYLVGGSVRDILLGKTPKDFDIATSAHPEQIKRIFRNTLLIGRRFRIAHVRFHSETIEVTTFRGSDSNATGNQSRLLNASGMLLKDNVYGTLQEDALRRDFSMNALYYNVKDFSIIDYCQGLDDIEKKQIRMIGEPIKRYQEDPVRLLRAIRLAAKFDHFKFEATTKTALKEQGFLLHQVTSSRLVDETLKLFYSGQALRTYLLLKEYNLLPILFPGLTALLDYDATDQWIQLACQNTDQRIREEKPVSSAFLFAFMLWPVLQQQYKKNLTSRPARLFYQAAIKQVFAQQHSVMALTRFLSSVVQEIWLMQPMLIKRHPRAINRLLSHTRFRAAYDFLLLRIDCHEISDEVGAWWSKVIDMTTEERQSFLQNYLDAYINKTRKNKKKAVVPSNTEQT